MKKLLTVSLVAVMAVSAAHADLASTAYVNAAVDPVDAKVGGLKFTEGSVIAGSADLTAAANTLAQEVANVKGGDITLTDGANGNHVSVVDGKINVIDTGAVASGNTGLVTGGAVYSVTNPISITATAADTLSKANKVTLDKLDETYATDEQLGEGLAKKEDVANKLTGETVVSADLTADKYMSALTVDRFVNDKIATVSSNTDKMIGEMQDGDQNGMVDNFEGTSMESDGDIVSALVTLDDVKQDKANAAYQIGTSDGGWVSLIASLPAECSTGTSVCSLVATGGNLSWEVIAGQAANDDTITSSVVAKQAAAE